MTGGPAKSASGVALVVAAAAFACGVDTPPLGPDTSDAGPDLGDWDRPITRPDDATATANRAACVYARGALPGETLGASVPVDQDLPIDTIVVLMQENRSFDSYFGQLNAYARRDDIESPSPTASVPEIVGDPASPRHPLAHAPHLCALDTNHEWWGAHLEYDDGKMDGFYEANTNFTAPPPNAPSDATDPARALWWYDQRDIPFYYALAATFAIGDHYFSSLLGPTWANRDYLYMATSMGVVTESFPDLTDYPFPQKDALIFDELEKRHVTWNIYSDGLPPETVAAGLNIGARWGRSPLLQISDFLSQAQSGTLPQVAFVDAVFGHDGPSGDDEHPPADIQLGQKFVSEVVQAVLASPQWSRIALFLTYDEHGGYYDHVPPPPACKPDDTEPAPPPGDMTNAHFDRYGIRVPLVVVSPWARPSFVSHVVHDHTSITRFIETKFRVPALTARDANADPMMEMFDFSRPAFPAPPPITAPPDPDPNEISYCVSSFGP